MQPRIGLLSRPRISHKSPKTEGQVKKSTKPGAVPFDSWWLQVMARMLSPVAMSVSHVG